MISNSHLKKKISILNIVLIICLAAPLECYSDAWDDKECVVVVAPAFIVTETYIDPYLYVDSVDFNRTYQEVVKNAYGKGKTLTLDKWWYTVPQRLPWTGLLVYFYYNGEWLNANFNAASFPLQLSHKLQIGSIPYSNNLPADLPKNCQAIIDPNKAQGPPDVCQ